MKKCFIFCIGGTGSRVLKSLIFLLSSGYKYQKLKEWEFVPILIDRDALLPAYNETIDLLKQYTALHKTIYEGNADDENLFFRHKIAPLKGDNDYNLTFSNHKGDRFDELIGYNQLNSETQHLVEMLFDYPITGGENVLRMDLNRGFKGVPGIGTVAFNDIIKSEYFSSFTTQFSNDDAIFLVGSVFGGTGASGMPLIAKAIRNAGSPAQNLPNGQALANASIGALLMLPYFRINNDSSGEQAIQSEEFILKTKAALKHYAKQKDINAYYYLADNNSTVYDYGDGGATQKNSPHIIEFIGALAALDFLENNAGGNSGQVGFEYGMEQLTDVNNKYHLRHFEYDEQDAQMKSFTNLYLLYFFYKNEWHQMFETSRSYATKFKKDEICGTSFEKNFSQFIGEFEKWLQALDSNQPSFNPFKINPSESMVDIIHGFPTKKGFFSKSFNDFIGYLNNVNNKKAGTDIQRLFGTLYRGINQFRHEKITSVR